MISLRFLISLAAYVVTRLLDVKYTSEFIYYGNQTEGNGLFRNKYGYARMPVSIGLSVAGALAGAIIETSVAPKVGWVVLAFSAVVTAIVIASMHWSRRRKARAKQIEKLRAMRSFTGSDEKFAERFIKLNLNANRASVSLFNWFYVEIEPDRKVKDLPRDELNAISLELARRLRAHVNRPESEWFPK